MPTNPAPNGTTTPADEKPASEGANGPLASPEAPIEVDTQPEPARGVTIDTDGHPMPSTGAVEPGTYGLGRMDLNDRAPDAVVVPERDLGEVVVDFGATSEPEYTTPDAQTISAYERDANGALVAKVMTPPEAGRPIRRGRQADTESE